MPATIIIRIEDEDEAASCLAAGVKDLATHFLPEAGIRPSKVTLIYRKPEDEAKAKAGDITFKEYRQAWPNAKVCHGAPEPKLKT